MNDKIELSPDFSKRDPAQDVSPQFSHRWSPRSFRKVTINQSTLTTIFDAARWSPSCFNDQPWKFITSTEETHDQFLALLVDGNQVWAKNASVLGFVLAHKHFAHNGKPNNFAAFDSGAAWMAMTLQANLFGLYTHGMGGVHFDQVYKTFAIDPEKYQVLCGFALGVADRPDQLPTELAAKEIPSNRKALSDIWHQGMGRINP